MSSSPNSKSKLEVKIKRSLKLPCELKNSQATKKIKSSLSLDKKLLNLLCEVDRTFISKLDSFNNKSEILQYLQILDKDLEIQLTRIKSPENKKQEIIKQLHDYNELKDTTQAVIGVISSLTGESVTELHKKFEVFDTN